MTLQTDCAALASTIAKKAQEEATPLAERIDALRALTGYFSAVQKAKGGDPPADEAGGFNFADGIEAPPAPEPEKPNGGTPRFSSGTGRTRA